MPLVGAFKGCEGVCKPVAFAAPDGLPPFKLLDKDKKSSVDLRTYCFAVPYAICDPWNIRLQQQGLVVPALMRESRSMKAGVAKQHVTIDSCHQRCGIRNEYGRRFPSNAFQFM